MTILKAILTLMVLAAFLPEVTTGSTPFAAFFTPGTFLFLVVLGYGLPVLVIREFAVRTNLSIAGIMVVGFAYGAYNEGLIAKTMIDPVHTPISNFDGYRVLYGINVPWALVISTYHALGSVLFPIMIAHELNPQVRSKPWINGWLAAALAVALLAFASAAFLGTSAAKIAGTPGQLAFFLCEIAAGVLVASRLRRGSLRPQAVAAGVRPVLLGISVVIPFIIWSVLGSMNAPLPVFVLAWAAVVAAYAWILVRRGWQTPPNLLLFAFGLYMQSVILSVLHYGADLLRGGLTFVALTSVVGGLLLELVFVWAAVLVQKRSGPHLSEMAAGT